VIWLPLFAGAVYVTTKPKLTRDTDGAAGVDGTPTLIDGDSDEGELAPISLLAVTWQW
jgi:hypothetical protein